MIICLRKLTQLKCIHMDIRYFFLECKNLLYKKKIIIKRVDLDLRNTSQLNPCRFRKALTEFTYTSCTATLQADH